MHVPVVDLDSLVEANVEPPSGDELVEDLGGPTIELERVLQFGTVGPDRFRRCTRS
jgi:hypothetical protein